MIDYYDLLSVCYNLNQRTDKKVLPVVSPNFMVNDEVKECLSRKQLFSFNIDKLVALDIMVEQIESEYIFLFQIQYVYIDDGLEVKIRYAT